MEIVALYERGVSLKRCPGFSLNHKRRGNFGSSRETVLCISSVESELIKPSKPSYFTLLPAYCLLKGCLGICLDKHCANDNEGSVGHKGCPISTQISPFKLW